MTVTSDVLIPALQDAREAHTAVIDRFRSDLAVTPPGAHRRVLERHVTEAQDHIDLIHLHVRELRPGNALRDTVEMVRTVAEGTVRTTLRPLAIGAANAAEMVRGRREADERELLRNTENEYTVAARALAACRAGQSIADQAHDQVAAELLDALRRQDEELLEALEDRLEQHARAVVAAADLGSTGQTGGGLTGAAARAVRTAVGLIRDAAQAGEHTAAEAFRQVPGVTRMAEEVHGAVTRQEDLPIPGYGGLAVTDITRRLRKLSQTDLTLIEGHERAHAKRPAVLKAIERLRGSEPWPGYDTMSAERITVHVQAADPALAQHVMDYEQSHRRRQSVVTAARQQRTRHAV